MNEFYSTPSASTLHPKSRPFDDHQDAVDQAIENFQRLNANQKQRYLDVLQKALEDSAWAKSGTGVKGKNIPSKDRRFNKEEFDLEEFDQELNDCIEGMGFNEEAKEKAADLFFEAVEARLFHDDDAFRQAIVDLINDCTVNPFISEEDLNVVELLATKIEELEYQIECVENENDEIRQNLQEGVQEKTSNSSSLRSPRRSSVNDLMCEADERNRDCLFNEDQPVADALMRRYLAAFGGE